MKEHYTKSTVEVQAWCKKCGKPTLHRVDGGRKGPCLECIDRYERTLRQLKSVVIHEKQPGLFK